jgi:ELWxxDGT repeat protein
MGVFLGLVCMAGVAAAQVPVLVKDINPATASSDPTEFVGLGGSVYFAAGTAATGRELWRTDGTPAGAVLVKDIVAGPGGSGPRNLTVVGGTLYFTADDGVHGEEVWKSDGTASGTVLVRDICAGSCTSNPRLLTAVAGVLYFGANAYYAYERVWRTDGTGPGTAVAADLSPGAMVAFSGGLFVLGSTVSPTSATGLWRLDPGVGSSLVKTGLIGLRMLAAGGLLYLEVEDGGCYDLWRSDGTTAGTTLLLDVGATYCNRLKPWAGAGSVLYFRHEGVLWRSDGTAVGTSLVKSVQVNDPSGLDLNRDGGMAVVDGTLFFASPWGTTPAKGLWRSDGTTAGTVLVKDTNPTSTWPVPTQLTAVNGRLFFRAYGSDGEELWVTDGSPTGTVSLGIRGTQPGSKPASLASVGGQLYVAADDGVTGAEPWRSDGSRAGTVRVADVERKSADSAPGNFTNVAGTLYFAANDGVSGYEPWRSDGTTTGTVRITDLQPGNGSSGTANFTRVRGRTVFSGIDVTAGDELRSTDGTPSGTALVKDITPGHWFTQFSEFTPVGEVVYFVARRVPSLVVGPPELWLTDGTAAGTAQVPDVVPVDRNDRRELIAVGRTLFFVARHAATGDELWRTDGSAGGTRLVKDICVGSCSSSPGDFVSVGATVYFSAFDGDAGIELWRSDGTEAGTVRVRDINPGRPNSSPSGLTDVNGTIFFAAGTGASEMRELWRSDGTEAGTVRVKDICPGENLQSTPEELTNVNGTLFFIANDCVHWRELWKSDGTEGGTVMVKDIVPGVGDLRPTQLVNVAGVLYFLTQDYSVPVVRKLWKSDGTDAGTRPVGDLLNPYFLTPVGNTLYLRADDGLSGQELWKVSEPLAPPLLTSQPAPSTIGATNVLYGGNFTAGSVVKLYVATASGPAAYGPYAPIVWTSTSLTWTIPVEVAPGNGFAAIQVVNTDTGYLASNVVGALLYGSEGEGIPTVTRINGASLGPAELAIGVAHVDTVVGKGATVTIEGTGFVDPVVNVFTAGGNIGPLVPLPGGTATTLRVVIPPSALTGPGNFQVINRPSYLASNAVSAVIGAVPTIAGVSAAGGTVTVTGTGFSPVSVINLYNLQGGGVVNLGGFGPGGAARIPLTVVSDTQFTFPRPAGAVAGPAFVEVLNPPFIPFSSSGSDPDGAFTMPGPAPRWTEDRPSSPGLKPRGSAGDDGTEGAEARGSVGDNEVGEGAEDGPAEAAATRELVMWTRAVGATADGDHLRGRAPQLASTGTTDGTPWRAARSGRLGADRGDGAAPSKDPVDEAAGAAAGAAADGAGGDGAGRGGRRAGGAWTSGARSTRALLAGAGAVTWTVRADAGDVAVGFGDADGDGSLADLAFAWRLDAATRELQVYERGVRQAAVGTYAPGDRLRIAVRAGAVEYRRNGALVFTSKTAPTYPLVVDASLGSPDATLRGVRLAGRLGTVIDWAAAPGVTVTSLGVARHSAEAPCHIETGAPCHNETGTPCHIQTGTPCRSETGTPCHTHTGTPCHSEVGIPCPPAIVVRNELVWPSPSGLGDEESARAVSADLRGAAGIGFGATACDYCLVRTGADTVQVRHAGVVRGTWPAPPGTRVRVEVGVDGPVRYWAGHQQLDEAAVAAPAPPAVRGWLGASGGTIVGAVIDGGLPGR